MRRGRRRQDDDDEEEADGDEGAAGADRFDRHALTQPLPSRSSAAAASAQDEDIEFLEDPEAAEAEGRSSTAAAAARAGAVSSSAAAASSSYSLSPSVDPAVLESLPENLRGWLSPIEASHRPGQAPLDHQSRSTRLRLLSHYSKLSEDIKLNPFLSEDNLHLQYAVHAADVLNSSVSHITEEIADAEQLSSVAGQGVKKVKKILGLQTALSVQGQARQQTRGNDGCGGRCAAVLMPAVPCSPCVWQITSPSCRRSSALLTVRWTGSSWERPLSICTGQLASLRFCQRAPQPEQNTGSSSSGPTCPSLTPVLVCLPLFTEISRGSFQHLSAPKQRKRREKRAEDKLKATAALTLQSDAGLESKQTQGRQAYMRHHFRRLTRRRSVLIWRLLIDPASFVRTVENFFDFSFLVREGVVSMEFRDGDTQLGFPFVRWRDNEQQRQKQRKRMQDTLSRLQAKLAEDRSREGEGEELGGPAAGNGDAEQPSADNGRQQWRRIFAGEQDAAAARREARRRRRDDRVLRILHHLKRMDEEDAADLTQRTKLALARQKQRFAADEDPASLTHFSPVLDWHVWSGLVLKLGLRHSLIPPMRPEDELRWRARGQHKMEEQKEEDGEDDNGREQDEREDNGKEEKRDGSQRQRAARARVRQRNDEEPDGEQEREQEEEAGDEHDPGSQLHAAKRRRGVQAGASGGGDEDDD